jgi:hypothetical protein
MGNALAWPHRTVETVTDPSDFEPDLCIRGESDSGTAGCESVAPTSRIRSPRYCSLSATARERSRTSTPQRFAFFGWIIGIATVLAAAEPFTTNARLRQVDHAATNIVIGLAIWSLVSGSAHRSQPAASSTDVYQSNAVEQGCSRPVHAEPPKAGTWLAARCAERAARAAPLRRR